MKPGGKGHPDSRLAVLELAWKLGVTIVDKGNYVEAYAPEGMVFAASNTPLIKSYSIFVIGRDLKSGLVKVAKPEP
jgi:hypothetical protein